MFVDLSSVESPKDRSEEDRGPAHPGPAGGSKGCRKSWLCDLTYIIRLFDVVCICAHSGWGIASHLCQVFIPPSLTILEAGAVHLRVAQRRVPERCGRTASIRESTVNEIFLSSKSSHVIRNSEMLYFLTLYNTILTNGSCISLLGFCGWVDYCLPEVWSTGSFCPVIGSILSKVATSSEFRPEDVRTLTWIGPVFGWSIGVQRAKGEEETEDLRLRL